MSATAITPVEFWNPVYPNETFVADGEEPDSALRRRFQFVGGYFRATEDWQVELLNNHGGDRVFRADSTKEITCPRCGWITKSVMAFQRHAIEEN